jgi:hypothetical protein
VNALCAMLNCFQLKGFYAYSSFLYPKLWVRVMKDRKISSRSAKDWSFPRLSSLSYSFYCFFIQCDKKLVKKCGYCASGSKSNLRVFFLGGPILQRVKEGAELE